MAKVYAPVLPGDDEDAAARADDLLVKVLLVKVLLEPTTCSAML
jgi:hypothetical protein